MSSARGGGPLLALLWVSAVTCRAPIIGVGPVLPRIIEDVGLSNTAAGLLFALPVFMMGLLAVPGGLVADAIGAARLIGFGLVAVAAAGALRAEGGVPALFVGTALVGGTIGTIQPGLPRIVREHFPARIGLGTAAYSLGFTAGSLLAVTITAAWLVPLLGGWRATFLVWSAVALLPALAWRRYAAPGERRAMTLDRGAFAAVLRDSLLWRIALLQMLNSAAFYAANAWLPAYYESLGLPPARAAAPLAVLTAVGAAAGFVAPILSDRLRARRGLLVLTCVLSVAGMAGFMAAPLGLVWVSAFLFGVGLFASFTVNLAVSVDAGPVERVGAATGMVFSVGHGGGLVGPLAVGLLRDLTGRFEAGMAAVLVMVVAMTALALVTPETYGGYTTRLRSTRRA